MPTAERRRVGPARVVAVALLATLAIAAGDRPEVVVDLAWTFPLRAIEVVSGDGAKVYRERLDQEADAAALAIGAAA